MTTRAHRARRPLSLVLVAGALAALLAAPGAAVASPTPTAVQGPVSIAPTSPPRAGLAVHREAARSLGRVNLRVAAKAPRVPRANRSSAAPPRLTWDRSSSGSTSPAVGPVGGALASAAGAVSDTPTAPAVGLGQANGFAGMSDLANDAYLDCGGSRPCVEPPDPWIAAGPGHLVQMVNIHTRITDRAGRQLLLAANVAFFGIPSTEFMDADPRVLYVPERDRWIASILSYGCEGTTDPYDPFGHLYLAVSTTGDPTGSWDRYVIDFPGTIPDYPGLGYGSGIVALSANEYPLTGCDGRVPVIDQQGYLGASLHVVDWADLLDGDGTATFAATSPNPGLFNWRPAPNLAADPTIHALVEMTPAAPTLGHATISGTIAGGDFAVSVPTELAGVPGLPLAAVPAPRDRGGSIPDAVDERVTDAVRLGSRLAYVHTAPCGSGTSLRDCVRVTELDVSRTTPTLVQSLLVDAVGTDTYMGGVGFSDDGTLYLVYSRSSPTTYVSSYAGWQRPADPRGAFGPGTALLAAGRGVYGGLTGNTRWGDYVGVARDPADPAAVWQANQYADTEGGWATWVSQLAQDVTPPVVSVPRPSLAAGKTIGTSTIPVTVAWTAADTGSGISSTRLQLSKNGGAFSSVTPASSTATSATLNLAPGTTSYTLRASATDGAGNVSPWMTRAPFRVIRYQETSTRITYTGTWKMAYSASYSGGRERYATTAGRRATLSAFGFSVAWVASFGSTRGSARVVVDGATARTYSLHSSATRHRRIVAAWNFGVSGRHTVGIKVAGTAGHPRVDVDAFVVLR